MNGNDNVVDYHVHGHGCGGDGCGSLLGRIIVVLRTQLRLGAQLGLSQAHDPQVGMGSYEGDQI